MALKQVCTLQGRRGEQNGFWEAGTAREIPCCLGHLVTLPSGEGLGMPVTWQAWWGMEPEKRMLTVSPARLAGGWQLQG